MSMNEDLLVMIRGIRKRPVESLLLILGIALGIGAAASGISIVAQTSAESKKLLDETRYREIVVKTRESAAEMERPAEQSRTDNPIFITANDLVAKNEIPAVQYAYVANRTDINFRDFHNNNQNNNTTNRTQPVTGNNESTNNTQPVTRNNNDQTSVVPRPDQPQPGGVIVRGDGPPDFMGRDANIPPLPEITDPNLKPTVDEIPGLEVSPEYFTAYNLTAAQGSLFTDEDIRSRAPMVILGSDIAKTLFVDGIALDKQVQIHRELVKIIGILNPTGTDLDKSGFVPVTIPDPNATDPRLRFRGWNTNLRFTVKDAGKLDAAKAQLTSYFERAYGTGAVVLSVPREEAQDLADRNSRLVTIILILAVSGLLIASVNVSNILYSRALRKRKSIGILKAMGAPSSQIFMLFFMEALIIGLGGAVLGSGVAVLLSGLMKTSLGIGGYSIGILGLGILLSLLTTLFLTNIPTIQTSKIPASEAIRYE